MVEKFVTSTSGLAAFAAYFGAAVVLLVLFAKIYEMVTPLYNEISIDCRYRERTMATVR